MGVEAVKWARRVKTGHVGSKAVLQLLAEVADDKTGRCFASYKNLAAWTEQGKRTVQRCIDRLERLSLVQRVMRTDETTDAQVANAYQLKMPWVEVELAILDLSLPPMAKMATAPSQSGQPPMAIATATPRGHSYGHPEVEVEGKRSTTTSSPRSSKPREGEEVVNDLWKRLKPFIRQAWHGGDEEVWIDGERVGLGMEKIHLGALVFLHGAESTRLAIEAAPHVWPDGWPRTLAWFASDRHGAENFHEALSFARRNRRGAPQTEVRRLSEIMRDITPRT